MFNLHPGVLFILGIGVFGGILGATLFQRMRIPQVVGYIALGILIGQSGLGLVRQDDILALRPFNLFALGLIGFLVGGELHAETFRKYGRQFSTILIGEGMTAFVLVGISTGLVLWYCMRDFPVALAGGIVFGAIASATDPASTVSVLWEYRAQGIVTTTLIAIVALDDALAMTLYGLGTSAAQILAGGAADIGREALKVVVHLGGAVGLGFGMGLLLSRIMRWMQSEEETIAIAMGAILVTIGLAAAYDMDIILASMTLGVTLTNIAPRRSEGLFSLVKSFSDPIYILFFVLVGARLGIKNMPAWLWWIIILYVLFRSAGKMAGAYFGALLSGAPAAVRRYCGLGLFAQGGVAVGLSIMASQHLSGVMVTPQMALGDTIIFGVTATTLIVQILGPPMVKLAIRLTGEIDRNVTEEDVIESWTVADAMDRDTAFLHEEDPLSEVFRAFSDHAGLSHPVVDSEGRIVGLVTLDRLKDVLVTQDTWDWLVAEDVMMPVTEMVTPDTPLKDALNLMWQLKFDRIPVVRGRDDRRAVGVLDRRRARFLAGEEVIRRHREAAASEGVEAPA